MSFNVHAARPATADEIKTWGGIWPGLKTSGFKILAPEQVEGSDGIYNCLGWVSGEVKDFTGFNIFHEDQLAVRCESP
jgi:hypothetical protein